MFHWKWFGLLIFVASPVFSGSGEIPREGKGPSDDGTTSQNNIPNYDKCLVDVQNILEDLKKYQYLRDLQNENEDLFYTCLIRHVNELLPIVYTPMVGEVCENYGKITGPKRGLTLAITDKNKVEEKLEEWKKTHPEVRSIVVTDGGRILGLGDLGANGMGIPVGKMAIYTALGGVHPNYCLPVTLDVGTNNEALRTDSSDLYVGLKEEREKGDDYVKFVDEFVTSAVKVFGPQTLIQFEDFANEHAFKFLEDYRERYTVFNDDIQGTAAAALAGLMAAERFTGMKLKDAKILFVGAGEAGVGIANLTVSALKEAGIPEETSRKHIFMKRSRKLIMEGDEYPDTDARRLYRKSRIDDVPEDANIEDLTEIIKWLKPDFLIGVSGKGGLFTKEVLTAMAENKEFPVVFPLGNPSARSECSAKDAYEYTQGKALFASGSPFPPVEVNGKLRSPQQCNNAYIFPGVALAITATLMKTIPDKVFIIAAETLANTCTQQEDFNQGSLFPKLNTLRDCSVEIATAIAKYAFENDLATVERPSDIKAFILENHYKPSSLP